MYPLGKPFPRLLPPVFLSPIHESEEEVQHISVKSDSCIVEVNNSSVIPKHGSVTACISNSNCSLNESVGSTNKGDRVVIESCSGRKLEDVEVLKQKYINSEIQDLPRLINGPIGHGRFWKTRRCILNLGSQDIRNQMNKINLKTGTNTTHADGERQLDYRCKKYEDASNNTLGIKQSVEEILYGDYYNPDDYDPELAALFENYIEECDHVTTKHYSAFPTACDTEQEKDIFTKYPMDPDSKHAFLCGYIEGMKQTDQSQDEHEHEQRKHGTELFDDSKDTASYRELISSQQDITHMSLREWEQVHRAEQQLKENNRHMFIKKSLTSKKPRHTRSSYDNNKSVPMSGECKEEVGDSIKANCKDCFTEAVKRENEALNENQTVVADIHKQMMDEGNAVLTDVKDGLSFHHGSRCVNSDLERTSFPASFRERMVYEHKNRIADLDHTCEDSDSIVKLAKRKLEHSLLTSRALEETYLTMIKAKLIKNDCKPEGVRKGKTDPKGNKTGISKVEAKGLHIGKSILDELDGWKTKNKAFIDQDSVQVSSSELLHPVESFEKLGSPMWTPSASTPLFTPADQKTPVANDVMSPVQPINPASVNDSASDLEQLTNNDSKSLKQRLQGVGGDYRKAAKLVKLRLTKSNDTVGSNCGPPADKSFANVPLSQCVNYSIEQSMRSSAMLTTNINLSEKLAQQLRELSNDSRTSALRHRENKVRASTEQNSVLTSETQTENVQSSSTCNLDGHKTQTVKVQDNLYRLPEIYSPPLGCEPKTSPSIPRQLGQDHNVLENSNSEFHSLPHISVKAFPNKTREDSKKAKKVQADDDGDIRNRGVAVRAGTCASPYTFDKGDPQMLHLRARPLPPLHKVCTSCGGISECREKIGKQKRKSKYNGQYSKSKTTHTRCCGSYVEDKWKLDERKCGHSLNFSSIGLGSHKVTHENKPPQQDEIPRPRLVLSPSTTQQKCEEMSINFMDKSIKFRFQCDVSVESNKQNEVKIGDKSGKWLDSLSTPTCKDRYQCPVTTETRIYKDSVRGNDQERENTPQAPFTSPYLDYCKYKADMRTKKKEHLNKQIEYLSDTCLPEDVYMKAAKKVKRFPVIPMKKSKESPRDISRQGSKSGTVASSGSSRKGSDCDLFVKSTKPARLPCMKASPYKTSRENFNNNGQRETWVYNDIKYYFTPARTSAVLILNC